MLENILFTLFVFWVLLGIIVFLYTWTSPTFFVTILDFTTLAHKSPANIKSLFKAIEFLEAKLLDVSTPALS